MRSVGPSVFDPILSDLALSGRNSEIVKFRLGLDGTELRTYQETAKRFGLSRERIRQIVSKVVRQLRHRSRTHLILKLKSGAINGNELALIEHILAAGKGSQEFPIEFVSRVASSSPAKAVRVVGARSGRDSVAHVYMRNVFGLDAIRRLYPRAYERWTSAEDDLLRNAIANSTDFKSIQFAHQRAPAAILERIVKLGLIVSRTFKAEIRRSQKQSWSELQGGQAGD